MMGAAKLFRPRVWGILEEPVMTDPEKTVFLRVIVRPDADGRLRATSSGGQGSHILSALAVADAFAVVPVGIAGLDAGALVELEMMRMPEARTAAEVTDG